MSIIAENLATNSDIKDLKQYIESRFKEQEQSTNAKFVEVRAEIAELKTQLILAMVALGGVIMAAIKFL